ncbi:alpha-galactosidase [Salisediminibacterium selenitireducens]|uniref:Alpha-galactosidase n=1 Tax=Bacillus selenitireducens (strain ATCC 700615 / DSM 15326 / MLS10) TaxID=439292 RepID=D6XXA0_BACIE|nr:alpha-galactosidase [Salisediminibacterium selenitireducens]ADH97957.1 glycoside hydrolase clan GH-D [[Bacillus] selenitireducens MLS10]
MIHVNEPALEFHLQNSEVSYLFSVMKNRQLAHLYFGKRIHHEADFSHLFRTQARAGMACVYEGDLTFSLDVIRQEYPSYGTSDFREPAFLLEEPKGSRITDFVFDSWERLPGKPAIQGLPHVYADHDSEAETLVITLKDPVLNARLRLFWTIYADRPVITRHAEFINDSKDTYRLHRAMSMNLDLFDSDYEMVQLSGSWARERHQHTMPLRPGVQSISSTRGTSSAQQNPFLALKRPDTNEHHGDVYGFNLVYSGNFLARAEVDQFDVTRVSMGINPFDFSWKLEGGETFTTPEAVLVHVTDGLNGMSRAFHALYRERLARGTWRDRDRPVLINNWEATYFDFDEEKLLTIAKSAKELGVELFVLDDGWFGKRNDDTTSLGDWHANTAKLPEGVKGIAEKINALGLSFGLWFEPEMVNKDSDLYRNHPDWVIHVPGRAMSHGRNQFVLDCSRQDVVDYLFRRMAAVLDSAPVDYVKWDMNRYMTEIGSAKLPADRQQELPHRYILGVYELYERLTSAFPHILFESCASGGARFDPGMLYYAPQAWTSDNTDAVERLKIQYGTSLAYPLSSMGAHVSAVPNHQVHRHTSLEMRGDVSLFGMFGYELDLSLFTDKEKAAIKEQISRYKQHRALIRTGTFYRLKSPFGPDGNETAWMVVSADQTEALVGWYRELARPHPGFKRLHLQGLNEDVAYRINDRVIHGSQLMHAGLMLPDEASGSVPPTTEKTGDFVSYVFHLSAE